MPMSVPQTSTANSAPIPSAYGYNTTAPFPRDAQQALKHREAREQYAIATGSSVVQRSVPPLKEALQWPVDNPLGTLRATPAYANEQERLQTDAADHLARSRRSERMRDSAILGHHKAVKAYHVQIYNDRNTRATEDSENMLREVAGTSLRNRGSVDYDLFSGQLRCPEMERKAIYREACMAHNVRNRTCVLSSKSNSTSYNIINGIERPPIVVPPRPTEPPQ